jgi:hypothetical protein
MEKKELIKGFKVIVEDIMDNYEKYTVEEKTQVEELFKKASELNAILDKYDVETKFSWQEYFTAVGKYFEAFH